MPMAGAPKKRQSYNDRLVWKDDMEQYLIDRLLITVQKGKRAENGFKKEAWTDVLLAMREKFTTTRFEVKQLKSKTDQLKKKYTIFQALCDNSGFGWNEEKMIPTAPDDVWERYMQVFIPYLFLFHYVTGTSGSQGLSYRDSPALS